MSEFVYFNGRILPVDEARLSPFDAGFAHAAGLFETLRAYCGSVMRLDDHLDRLFRSAALLEMQIPVNQGELTSGIEAVLEANGLADARVRLTVTPGPVPRAEQPQAPPDPPTVFITAGPVRPYPAELYRLGMRVCICPYKQNRFDPLAGHKTLAYLPRLLAMKDAAERRCNESLWFTTENRLAEGSICNVFIVEAGALVTPPVDTPILPGTVRKAVLELAQAAGLAAAERSITIEELLSAQEVFLTGSVLEVMPATSIEKHQVGEGTPGPVTTRLASLYKDLVARECPARS